MSTKLTAHPLFTFISLLAASVTLAQQPAPTPKEVAIRAVTFESGTMAGSNRPWIKVVTQFDTTPKWADGIAFNYVVLVGTGNQFRVLPGMLRYANVKGGANRAVMYISPNTAERFGPPLAVHVKAFYKDDQADEFSSKLPATVQAGWETKYNRYPGLLLNVLQTPFVFSDYSTSPDIFATQ